MDTTVQEKAIAYPVDSRLLEIARHKVVAAAKRAGITLKQTFVREGKTLRRKAGGYAHAKQFRRLRKVLKRQCTILGIVLREVGRKMEQASATTALTLNSLRTLMQRAERIRSRRPKDKNKLYALHAPEVECIGKGKVRQPYEFGVKVSVAVTHKQSLMVSARSFTGNPCDGRTLNEQLEQATILTEYMGNSPKQVIVDLGFRGVDADNPGVQIIHRGKFKSLTEQQRHWLKRWQAVESAIGHLKHDHAMDRCWLPGATGDALYAVLCAAGYNIRWLLWAIVRLGLKGLFAPLSALLGTLAVSLTTAQGPMKTSADRATLAFARILQGRLDRSEVSNSGGRLHGQRFETRRQAMDEVIAWLCFGTTAIGCIRRWPTSARCASKRTGRPIARQASV